MTALVWDKVAERFFETGTDRGVLYIPNVNGLYTNGVAWNGLYGVTESPSGAEPTKQYADNIVYITQMSAEMFGGTIEAFTCPDEFWQYDGVLTTASGMKIGQQKRPVFGFAFRSKKGNALNEDAGYILHLVYGAQASPSEKAYKTINDTPEPTRAHFNAGWNDFRDVGNFPKGRSPYGLFDMAGNGWEWVSSAYLPYPYDATDGREDLTREQVRGTRGGGQDSRAEDLTTTHRGRHVSRNFRSGHHNIGFRCAR